MSITDQRQCYLFPITLSDCVEKVTRPALKAKGLAGSRVLTEWPSIVGTSLAGHTMPEKLAFPKGQKTNGTLTIACENGFATELQHMQPMILERLATYFGYPAVQRITISHSWIPASPAPVAPPSLSPTLPTDCTRLAANVADEELKAALHSLGQTLSGQTLSEK